MLRCSLQNFFFYYSNSTFKLDLPFPQRCKLMSLNRVCHILFQQGLVRTSPTSSFLLLLNYAWFCLLSYLRIKIITNENYFGCGRFVIVMIGLRKHQARVAHLFVHFFSGRCFTRLQRETS